MMMMMMIFSGNANPTLTADVCQHVRMTDDGSGAFDVLPARATVSSFSDGETKVQILDSVRNADVFVVQPTCAPANQNLMELLVMVDALRRASAGPITAVMPYFGYARQDRKAAPRTPITASLVAGFLEKAGVTRVVTVDLHAAQIQGFFRIPVDNLYAKPALLPYLRERFATYAGDGDVVVVSPDAGGLERARVYSKAIPGTTAAAIDKRRERANECEVVNVIGNVHGKRCLIVDDMIDTAGTLVKAAEALVQHGATEVSACATHGVFSGPAEERIRKSVLKEVIVTDTIPIDREQFEAGKCKVGVVPIAPLLAEAILRIHQGKSVNSLFG
jgi:ribose-phosphate pyrophosphokinase